MKWNIYSMTLLRTVEIKYDKKFINIENSEGVILTITIGYMNFKPQFFGLSKKNQKCKK